MTRRNAGAGAAGPRSGGAVTIRTARNIAAIGISQVAGKASTLVWTLVAARQLTQGEFGAFSLAMSVALLISACAEWGFDPVLIRRASQRPELLERHYAEAVSWQSAIGIPVFIAAGIAFSLVRPGAAGRTTLALLLLAVFLDLWSDTSRAVSAAALHQAGTAAALVVQRLATMLLAVPVLLAGGGTVGLAGAVLGAYLVGWVAHQAALRRLGVRFRLHLVNGTGIREFVRGTWVIGLSALVLMALFRVDAVLLAEIKGDRALGAYSAAYRLFETALFLTFAVSSAVFPLMSVGARDGPTVRRGVETGLATLAVAYLPFAAICLVDAPGILELLFGAPYGETSAGALRWLALAPMAFAVAYLASAALAATERTRGLLLGAAVALVTNLGLNLVLIPRFAGTGAGFVTTVSYAVEAVVLLAAVARVSGRVQVARPLFEAGLASALLALGLWASPLPTAVEVPLGAAVYLGSWTALARRFSPHQLQVVRDALPHRNRTA